MKFMPPLMSLCMLIAIPTVHAQEISTNPENVATKPFLEELFWSNKTFEEITAEADAHFKRKYPDLSLVELTTGEHRDGKFVKYQRWKSFWKDHVGPDGRIYDFTQLKTNRTNARKSQVAECDDNFIDVDWTNVNYDSNMGYQIDQGRVSSIGFHPTDPNTFYVGAAWGGLWKTTDGGSSYTNVNDNLPLSAVAGIAFDPENPDRMVVSLSDIVWYGPPGIGVYYSEDGGATFSPTTTVWGLADNIRIYYMDQNPNNPNEIIIATNAGLYKTTDFFATSELVDDHSMRHVVYSRNTENLVFAGGNSGQLYKSEDGGTTFEEVDDFGNGRVRIAVSYAEGSEKIALTNSNSVHTSSDNGQTFETHGFSESDIVISFDPTEDNTLYSGFFEINKSEDFGNSFTALTDWLGDGGLPHIHVDQRNLFVNPLQDNYLYICNDGGVFRYDTQTGGFSNLSSDLIITQYYDIAVAQTDDNVLAGGSQDNGNIYRASNGLWDAYAPTGDGMGQDIDPTDASTRYWSYQFGGLRRYSNFVSEGIAPPGEDGEGSWETPFKLDPNNSDRLLVGYNTVYASDDKGDNWYAVGDEVTVAGKLTQLAIAPTNSEKIYAVRDSYLYVKEPGEDDWQYQSTPASEEITDIEVDPLNENKIYICYNGYTEDAKVFYSEDAGENWTNITNNLPNVPVVSLEMYDEIPGVVFIGTYGAVYYRDNTSDDWKKYGCIPFTGVNDIEIQYNTKKIFIGTHGRGMFEAPILLNNTSVESDMAAREAGFQLYPNPATDRVNLSSEKWDLRDMEIRLTDLMGRQVMHVTETGAYKAALDCSSLEAGVYLVQLKSKDQKVYVMRLSLQ